MFITNCLHKIRWTAIPFITQVCPWGLDDQIQFYLDFIAFPMKSYELLGFWSIGFFLFSVLSTCPELHAFILFHFNCSLKCCSREGGPVWWLWVEKSGTFLQVPAECPTMLFITEAAPWVWWTGLCIRHITYTPSCLDSLLLPLISESMNLPQNLMEVC